jgi:uncharacterized membrane protein
MNFFYISIIYLVVDLLWIQTMTPLLYRDVFETIQQSALKFNPLYAILAYQVLLAVLYYICRPLSQTDRYKDKPWLAYGLVGFSLYSVYNLTNAAIFSKYSNRMIIVDTIWGTSVFALLGWLDSLL